MSLVTELSTHWHSAARRKPVKVVPNEPGRPLRQRTGKVIVMMVEPCWEPNHIC